VTAAADDMRRVARTLADVAHALSAADQSGERVIKSLTCLGQIVRYDRCALLELLPNAMESELYTVPELSPAEREALGRRLTALLHIMGDDAEHSVDPGPPEGPESMHLAIPLVGLNRVIGVLFVEQRCGTVEDPYDEHSLRLLSIVAAQLGAYLTTLRLHEEEIEHARQLGVALRRLEETDRRKDDFLALLGHELRNPIGAIHNALRIIDHRDTTDVERYHALIDRQIGHLSRIVDDLLDASRVRLGKVTLVRRPLDLRDAARRCFEAFSGTTAMQAHAVTLELAPEPVIVDADPVRIEQVFSNLLANALKYTPPLGEIRMSVAVEGAHGVARLRDGGIGMTPEVLRTVFELFTQADESLSRSQGGLGLGLPLVRSLVEQHGGTVDATSEGRGLGSEFVVRLPLCDAAGRSDRPVPASREPARPLRVVVVEDNPDARATIEEILVIWGHTVESAPDGHAGVELAMSRRPDVMMIDIGLPGIDGYGVARIVRAELGMDGPALFAMTGYGQPEDRRRALDAGFDAHFVKPVNVVELQQRLAAIRPRARR
jgi:signal transduction histidine kinase/CheY-like chemotaxis protein